MKELQDLPLRNIGNHPLVIPMLTEYKRLNLDGFRIKAMKRLIYDRLYNVIKLRLRLILR